MVEQKILQTAEDTLYPAVFGLFRDSGATTTVHQVTCDRELPSKIAEYIERSAAQMKEINCHLAAELAHTECVILWGAGQLAMKLLALPSLARMQVRAVVDNNPTLRGKNLRGAPVVGPKELVGGREPIIIATLLHADEIRAQIRRLGLANPVFSLLPDPNPEIHHS